MSNIYLWLVLVPIVLIASLFGFGMVLPATREGHAEIEIRAEASHILGIIRDVRRQAEWRSGIGAIEMTDDGWRERTKRGETIRFRWVETAPGNLVLAFRSDAGYTGQWSATLTQAGEVTRILATESATVENPFRRLLARIFFNPGQFAATYLSELKTQAER